MYSASRKIRPLSHRSRDARHSRGDYSSILRTYESGYTLEERKKKGTDERGRRANSRVRRLLIFSSTLTSDIRSAEFAFIIYLKTGIRWADKQRGCSSVYPPGESRGVEKELFFSPPRSDCVAPREPAGIVARLLQRVKNVAHPPRVRVIKVVARNLPVLSWFRRYVHPAREKIYFKLSATEKRQGGLPLRAEFTAFAHSKYIFIVARHTNICIFFYLWNNNFSFLNAYFVAH